MFGHKVCRLASVKKYPCSNNHGSEKITVNVRETNMGVEPKIGGKPPKMDGENKEKPY